MINATGEVLDNQGDPLVGASVTVNGTNQGVVADLQGRFSISVPQGTVLTFSMVGYMSKEIEASTDMYVVLNEDAIMLDEVVAIGYGSVKRKDVTTAISSVTAKEMENRPLISAAQAIQGKAAGVAVSSPNGQPGGEMTIRVRGTTSFNGSNDPLYVVDGVPVDNIKFLSPQDIETMQILKDASSAAIYGSRAANGVILITTKSGKTGDARISFNLQYGISKVRKTIESLNAQQYADLMAETGYITLPEGLTDTTDWFDETFRTGNTQTYSVSVSQATDKLKYYFAGNYTREHGVVETARFNRYNFRSNVESKIKSWLTFNTNISYSDYTTMGGGVYGAGANRCGLILSVINTPTYAPIYDPENPERFFNRFYGINITSPAENMAVKGNEKTRENRLLASGDLLFSILPELTVKTKFTLDRLNSHTTNFLDPEQTSWGRNDLGSGSDSRNTMTIFTWDNIVNYNLKVQKNNFDFMVGTSYTDSHFNNNWINGSHYRDGSIQTLNVANKISWDGTGSGASSWGMMSYIGRVAYNYDSRYLITANVRFDGSSKLHPNHRWATFPSISAAWRLSQEAFMKDASWLTDLKIRGGWGKTGNQSGIGDFAYLQRYNIKRYEWWQTGNENAVPSIEQANLRTNDLTWEKTTQSNVGVDFSILNGRFGLVADWYYKRTTDMLTNVTLPSGAAAVNNIVRNEGEMINKGFEFAITSHNITNRDFDWTTELNMSFNKNKLTKLEFTKVYYDGQTSDRMSEQVVRNQPGMPLGSFYGYICDGVDPQTGDLIYRDLNQNGECDPGDRTYIGDPNPKFTYGMTNSLRWKNFNLSIFLQGSYGNDVYNASRVETEGMYDCKNQSTRVLNRWTTVGQVTDVPRAGYTLHNSTYFVEDGSYLRVKDITLSYNFDGNWMKKAGISRIQPYFTATNLLTWTSYKGFDPEVNQWGNSGAVQGIDWGTYPQCKSFTFGVNIEF